MSQNYCEFKTQRSKYSPAYLTYFECVSLSLFSYCIPSFTWELIFANLFIHLRALWLISDILFKECLWKIKTMFLALNKIISRQCFEFWVWGHYFSKQPAFLRLVRSVIWLLVKEIKECDFIHVQQMHVFAHKHFNPSQLITPSMRYAPLSVNACCLIPASCRSTSVIHSGPLFKGGGVLAKGKGPSSLWSHNSLHHAPNLTDFVCVMFWISSRKSPKGIWASLPGRIQVTKSRTPQEMPASRAACLDN